MSERIVAKTLSLNKPEASSAYELRVVEDKTNRQIVIVLGTHHAILIADAFAPEEVPMQ